MEQINGGTADKYAKENPIVDMSGAANDHYVYALYCGKSKENYITNENKLKIQSSLVQVYDWEGTHIKDYELVIPCRYICITEDDSRLWAIATEPEMALVYFDLKEASHTKKTDSSVKPAFVESKNSNFFSEENENSNTEKMSTIPW